MRFATVSLSLCGLLIAATSTLPAQAAKAVKTTKTDVIHIEYGNTYDGYSNDDLRRRVWQLERAVAQLQDQVFDLARRDNTYKPVPALEWTCTIQSFGKTHTTNAATRASALAQVLKTCSDASNAIHCSESDVKCDNK